MKLREGGDELLKLEVILGLRDLLDLLLLGNVLVAGGALLGGHGEICCGCYLLSKLEGIIGTLVLRVSLNLRLYFPADYDRIEEDLIVVMCYVI